MNELVQPEAQQSDIQLDYIAWIGQETKKQSLNKIRARPLMTLIKDMSLKYRPFAVCHYNNTSVK